MAMNVVDGNRIPVGFASDSDMATAQGLPSIPANARVALIQATGDDIYWRDDGTAATADANSMLLVAGDSFFYTGQLEKVSIIEASVASVLRISYYK